MLQNLKLPQTTQYFKTDAFNENNENGVCSGQVELGELWATHLPFSLTESVSLSLS